MLAVGSKPAVRSCASIRPPTHLACSLLLAEGASVVQVARQAGHSLAMTLSTYGHVYTLADARANAAKQRPAKKRGDGWHPAGARPRPAGLRRLRAESGRDGRLNAATVAA
jgi:hypothetical protein